LNDVVDLDWATGRQEAYPTCNSYCQNNSPKVNFWGLQCSSLTQSKSLEKLAPSIKTRCVSQLHGITKSTTLQIPTETNKQCFIVSPLGVTLLFKPTVQHLPLDH